MAELCTIEGMVCSAPSGGDPMVQVDSVYCTLSGYLVPMVFSRGSVAFVGSSANRPSSSWGCDDYDHASPGADQIQEGEELWGLPVAALHGTGDLEYDLAIHFLVLRHVADPMTEERVPVYKRIGIFAQSILELESHTYILGGKDLLAVLRKLLQDELNTETTRINEWKQRDRCGEDQCHLLQRIIMR